MEIRNTKSLLNLVHETLAQSCVMAVQEESVLMNLLPFIDTKGSHAYLYNVIDEFNQAEFRNINEDVTAGHVDPIQMVERLRIASSDVKIDRVFVNGTLGTAENDVKAEQTQIAMVSLAHLLESQFLYGTDTGKEFLGLYPRLAKGIGKEFKEELTMDNLDECLDYVSYGAGTKVIVCNPKTRRALNKLMRANGLQFSTTDMFGKSVTMYDTAVIYPCEAVKDDHIFFVNLEESIGVAGLTSGGMKATDLGYRGAFYEVGVEMLVSLKTPHPRCFAVLNTVKAPATA